MFEDGALKAWQAIIGVLAAAIGVVVMLWKNSLAGVSENTKIITGEIAFLRQENADLKEQVQTLKDQRGNLRQQLIQMGETPVV